MEKKDVLSATDFDRNYIESLFALADMLLPYSGIDSPPDTGDERYHEMRKIFAGHQLCSAFFGEGNSSASTRTKRSFELAMKRLGGGVISFSEKGSSIEKGESKERTLKNLDGYCDLFVVRDREDFAPARYAKLLKKPVINAGDGNNEHPTQWLVDAYSLRKLGKKIDGIKIAFVGDLKGRVVNSGIKGLMKFNDVKILGVYAENCRLPEERKPSSGYTEIPLEGFLEPLRNFGPDVIYWTRVQKNLEKDDEKRGSYSVGSHCINQLPAEAIWMHPQPIPDEELPPEFDRDPRAIWFRQAHYGVPLRMALITDVLGYSDNVRRLFE